MGTQNHGPVAVKGKVAGLPKRRASDGIVSFPSSASPEKVNSSKDGDTKLRTCGLKAYGGRTAEEESAVRKRFILSVLLVFAVVWVFIAPTAGARVLDEARIRVMIEVPVMQRFTIVEPAVITNQMLSATAAADKPLVFENV